jgi:cell division protein FtsI (penicillin-binding protein 3)
VDGRYAAKQYNPNFVGLFPADAPQLVIVVKLSNPQGNFYGGATAAPVTKAILQAALASRDAALDRTGLASAPRGAAHAIQTGAERTAVATAVSTPVAPVMSDTGRTIVVDLPPRADRAKVSAKSRNVPNVRGMRLRDAVRSLHNAGFRVQLARGTASTNVTEPAPGALVSVGSLVRLRYSQ